ncbi:ribosome biogenesis protein ytm1 [Microbotryomycetes sp. JL201]|nr:ribosome biogenesis protein ytm1 [Microbotryomycetes sp. JL201]
MATTAAAYSVAESTSASTPGGQDRQIAVRLTTKDAKYSIPPTKFLIPASWRRFHLSELINQVLETSSPVPFDFLINSTLLRTTLGQYCLATNTSEEVTLEIEYLPSTLPPKLESTTPAQDWISDISLAQHDSILSASYAGTLSLASSSSTEPLTFSGHLQAVLSCCYVDNAFAGVSGHSWVASGGMDRIARVWQYQPAASTDSSTAAPTPQTLYTLHLHNSSVSSVRARQLDSSSARQSPHLLTAGWDGLIGLWDLSPGVNESNEPLEAEDGDENGDGRKKKRRKQATSQSKAKAPINVLRGHEGKVSSAIFDHSSATTAYSAGWDHTVRSWDLETGSETAAKASTCDKVIYSLAQMATPNLLATGTADRQVCFFDLRTSSDSSSAPISQNISLTLFGHTSVVSSVKNHPTKPLTLVSGSFDGTVRVWDARSPKQSLFVLPMPALQDASSSIDKVLSVDWDGDRIVAGGQGSQLVQWRVSESGEVAPAA